jgi:hypothetical protein
MLSGLYAEMYAPMLFYTAAPGMAATDENTPPANLA